jgi:hypothetical protein
MGVIDIVISCISIKRTDATRHVPLVLMQLQVGETIDSDRYLIMLDSCVDPSHVKTACDSKNVPVQSSSSVLSKNTSYQSTSLPAGLKRKTSVIITYTFGANKLDLILVYSVIATSAKHY